LRGLTPSDFDLLLLLFVAADAAASFSARFMPLISVRCDAALVLSMSEASRLSPTEMIATCHARALVFR